MLALTRRIVFAAVNIFEILLFVRAVLSWFPQVRASSLREFLFYTTEPLLSPVRKFIYRFEWAQRLPIDLSWIVVYILLQAALRLISG